MTIERPDVQKVLSGLKDFQLRTVQHAFHQLYDVENSTGRFLVADEVGLGKTLVARGLVAKVVDHLWDKVRRIDVVYICSNADIARQNIQRLRLGDGFRPELATRITMLPVTISNLRENRLNFISLTPGTSFDLKTSLGKIEERALLYIMLSEGWSLRGVRMQRLMQGDAGLESFRKCIADYQGKPIDHDLKRSFIQAVSQENWINPDGTELPVSEAFESLMSRYREHRINDKRQRNALIGHLRTVLAVTCLHSLEPDLVILDEFQRFKHLFQSGNEAGMLAQNLFNYASGDAPSTRLLLLSATPYKMYSLHSESAEEDHYRDFIDTMRFLLKDEEKTQRLEESIRAFRDEVFRIGGDSSSLDRLHGFKRQIETQLQSVMSRTERLSISEDRNGMLTQMVGDNLHLHPGELRDYVTMQSIAEVLESGDILEYWKTAPYLLNFMDGYQFKNTLVSAAESRSEEVGFISESLHKNPEALWPKRVWQDYGDIDLKNPRLRQLTGDMVDNGAWRLLWLPPSLPYYRLSGVFADQKISKLTKRLIFSGWRVVPKAIASILSYEVERRMIKSFDESAKNTIADRRRRRGLLNFAFSDGRLTGMPVISLMYPCSTFANLFDPLTIVSQYTSDENESNDCDLPSVSRVVQYVTQYIENLLDEVFGPEENLDGLPDESWYWAAPVLLDLHFGQDSTKGWWERYDLTQRWEKSKDSSRANDGEADNSRWAEHVEKVRELINSGPQPNTQLGRRPENLARTLAYVALAGPGVIAFRALKRCFPLDNLENCTDVRDTAAQIGWAFRSLFNVPEFSSMIRGLNSDEPYWLRALEYCLDGCLQAVVDEYIHCIFESRSLDSLSRAEALNQTADVLRGALSLRTTRLTADDIRVRKDHISIFENAISLRTRFAQRFGDEKSEGVGSQTTRATQVRDAFNSPFWPFVLVTTSIGQEGLDFHTYCHSVMHWDLPSNPVDLEQREGRVHRYKGHAIRKNIALKYGPDVLQKLNAQCKRGMDPWTVLFEMAVEDRPEGESELNPFWVFPVEGGAQIERHVPALPMSRDLDKLTALRRTLAVYRMVFGQPRQDDLIEYLLRVYGPRDVSSIVDELRIDLSPAVDKTASENLAIQAN